MPNDVLRTTAGDLPLQDYRLRLAGHEWSILHTSEVLTEMEEQRFLSEDRVRLPYGVTLWPAAIALAHDIADRGAAAWRGRRVLELGAGTGLPGIVAATFGAHVVQTDKQPTAMAVCQRNGERNRATGITYRLADWAAWDDTVRYDWILGADVMYAEGAHPLLRRIFETNLAPGGKILLSDPLRSKSFELLESLDAEGWKIAFAKWTVGSSNSPRAIGVYELAR